MAKSEMKEKPIDQSTVRTWHTEADVIIVGGGGAGISAAIEAAELGADVIVLEASGEAGGSTAIAGGLIYMGGGTPVQKDCGFEDDIEEMYKFLLLAAGPRCRQGESAPLLRALIGALRLAGKTRG